MTSAVRLLSDPAPGPTLITRFIVLVRPPTRGDG